MRTKLNHTKFKRQILPSPRASYDPVGNLKKAGYVQLKTKPKNITYQGAGEFGTFYYDFKKQKTYIQDWTTRKYWELQ